VSRIFRQGCEFLSQQENPAPRRGIQEFSTSRLNLPCLAQSNARIHSSIIKTSAPSA
jgi:hypothetical protein